MAPTGGKTGFPNAARATWRRREPKDRDLAQITALHRLTLSPTKGPTKKAFPSQTLSPRLLSYIEGAWAEDRATRGRDPSAGPGAKTGEGGTMPPHGLPGLARKR